MSASPFKADISRHSSNVRYVPKADISLFDHLKGRTAARKTSVRYIGLGLGQFGTRRTDGFA
jgi:hypothetical protein